MAYTPAEMMEVRMMTGKALRRLGLPVTSWVSEQGRIYMAVLDGDDYLTTANGGRETATKKSLLRMVLDVLKADQDHERNFQRRLIMTNDGTVLLVEYRYGGWGYQITRKGASGASACLLGPGSTLEDAVENAHRHAESAYGGIAWETPL